MDVAGPGCGVGAGGYLGGEFIEDEAEVRGAFAAGEGGMLVIDFSNSSL